MAVRRTRLVALLALPLVTGLALAGGTLPTQAGGSLALQDSSGGDAVSRAVAHLQAAPREYGVSSGDVEELSPSSAYPSRHTGATHVNLAQRHDGLEVFGAVATVTVTKSGDVAFVGQSLVADLAEGASGSARTDAVEAVEAAADALDLEEPTGLRTVRRATGPAQETTLSGGGISDSPIPVRQVGSRPTTGCDWPGSSSSTIPPTSTCGTRRSTRRPVSCWPSRTDLPRQPRRTGERPLPRRGRPGRHARLPRPGGGRLQLSRLRAPKESPNDGDRTPVSNPADGLASPHGWHDTDGLAGPEFTTTRGNNVHAYLDRNNDNQPDAGQDVEGGPELTFDFPLDLSQQPTTYQPAAVANLFYMNNVVHDVMYRYGLDEVSGNFQANKYGATLANGDPVPGGDYVRAEAQDGGGVNNANFSTPANYGGTPRMQMCLWNPPGFLPFTVAVDPPSSAAGTYGAAGAAFGPAPDGTGVSGAFALADDGTALPQEGCSAFVGFPAGAVAIVDRGTCPFVQKVANAQAAGTVAVVVANNVAGAPGTMGGTDPTITIPSVMVSLADGTAIKAGLPATGRLSANTTALQRDGDLENGIIIHEYGHGISNRLTGGPGVNCLTGNEQMGEGWSDYLAIAMLMDPALDDPEGRRGMGPYALYQDDRTGAGIRPAPYSRNMEIQPFTYDRIKTNGWVTGGSLAIPHGIGHTWAATLWGHDLGPGRAARLQPQRVRELGRGRQQPRS